MATLPPPEAHAEGQIALAALALDLLERAWALFDPENIAATIERFRDAVQAVVDYYGSAAAAAALDYFKAARRDAGVAGKAPSVRAPEVPPGFIDQLVTEAAATFTTDEALGRDLLDSGAEQLILEQGRRQLMSAAQLDREAKGWARVPNEGACSFCLMLALRGPVYGSRRSASFKAHTKRPNGAGGDCRCNVEPVFSRWEPSARVREAQKVWNESTGGRSGHDARTAFRQAVEGRKVTGAPGKSSTSRSKATGRKSEFAAPSGKTVENQRAQLDILRALPPAQTPQAAEWRTKRIAEIRKFLAKHGDD